MVLLGHKHYVHTYPCKIGVFLSHFFVLTVWLRPDMLKFELNMRKELRTIRYTVVDYNLASKIKNLFRIP